MPPVDGGPIKAAIMPASDFFLFFFTGNGFSENMPAVQAERRIIVRQVASVFPPPPFTPRHPPPTPSGSPADKRTNGPRRDHVRGTLSPRCAPSGREAGHCWRGEKDAPPPSLREVGRCDGGSHLQERRSSYGSGQAAGAGEGSVTGGLAVTVAAQGVRAHLVPVKKRRPSGMKLTVDQWGQ